MIRVENIQKTYGSGQAAVSALRGMSFSIASGEFTALMGPSGSGKSTLLSILGAMNAPTSGHAFIDDMDIYELNQDKRADFRREYLGFVFQSFHLIPYLSLLENVMLPLATKDIPSSEKKEMAHTALDKVGLGRLAKRLPGEVSGGEQERAALARAMVNLPPILLADEPTGNLDQATSREIMTMMTDLADEGMTIVMVTHSPECAAYASRIIQMADGLMTNDQAPALALASNV